LRADGSVTVSIDVTNTGKRAGDEVVQLYVQHVGSAVERPVRELKGYARISLTPGEMRTVTFRLSASALAYWSVERHGWVVEQDTIRIQVGASSADIRGEVAVKVGQ
jgi:beta-glucosidase